MTDQPMIATKDRLGEYDAIETAKPNEPLFPIQGGDPFGPPTVLHWARLAREAGMVEPDPKKADRLLRKATDAEQVAWAMQSYQRGEEKAAASGKRASYSGHVIEQDEDTERARKMRAARIKGADRLSNLVGMGTDIAQELEALECCPPEMAALRNAIDQIKAVAHAVEPRRENERS